MARKSIEDPKQLISELYPNSCERGGRLEVVAHNKDSLKWVFCEECSTNSIKDSLNYSYTVCKYNPRRTVVEDEDSGCTYVFDCALEYAPYFGYIFDCEEPLDSDSAEVKSQKIGNLLMGRRQVPVSSESSNSDSDSSDSDQTKK